MALSLEESREKLRVGLDRVFAAIMQTRVIKRILDRDWYDETLAAIRSIQLDQLRGQRLCPEGWWLYLLFRPAAAEPWFQRAWDLIEIGRSDELTEDQRIAVDFIGPDPLRSFLPLFDERLAALVALHFKQKEVADKIAILKQRRCVGGWTDFAFELSVLGEFARCDMLADLDVPVGSTGSTVDGEVRITDRSIFIEITNTNQEVMPRMVEADAFDGEPHIQQVVEKTRKKVADGRQLALVQHAPTILFIARAAYGAQSPFFEWGVEKCFEAQEFARLSALVEVFDWKCLRATVHIAPHPVVPLVPAEVATLKQMFS